MEPNVYYNTEIKACKTALQRLKKQRNLITISKLLVFAALVWQVYALITQGHLSLAYPLLTVAGFIVLNRLDSRLVGRLRLTEELLHAHEAETACLQGDLSPFPAGEEYADPAHPYSGDLDLFGEDSLFRHLNRTVTDAGTRQLVAWLLHPCLDAEEILRRQEAVRELSALPGWCQQFRASGKLHGSGKADLEQLRLWQADAPFFARPKATRAALCAANGIVLAGWACTCAGILTFSIPLTLSFLQLLVLSFFLKKANSCHARLNTFIRVISHYLPLVRLIRQQGFSSTRLAEINDVLFHKEQNALRALAALGNIQENLDQRGNFVAAFLLNGLYLRDLHTFLRLDAWKKSYGNCIETWTDAIAQTDALVSMALFRYNHPAYVFPAAGDRLDAQDMGHPLLRSRECVTNDFTVAHDHRLFIVTGANMAGKSTFLRTVGVNLVLAQSGNVVYARRFTFRPTALFTSMRTTDNLAKDTSYFHAELLRLRQLVDMASREAQVFIILDEMLKGTNSVDKLNGSLAFLRKLLQYPVCGLVATHDLALGELAKECPEHFTNLCFEITHRGDEIQYDYKLHPGVSRTMNATILMQQMGLI